LLEQGLKAQGKLTLCVRVTDADDVELSVDAPGAEGYILGRSDVATQYLPDIDLSPYEGQQKSISRRHAALVHFQGCVSILDLESVNGTFVNGKRLIAHTPYVLKPGDEIRLANLGFIIS
jgi:pSer/pThr/pTyr-binding forkhead associated (FHA) protein